MTLSAFGVKVQLKKPAFPHAQPKIPAQTTHITSGQAIYTTSRASISPQTLGLTIRSITPTQRAALSDFIENVIVFSAYPCRIETGLDTFDNMHLIRGWDSVISGRGDRSDAVLRFREGSSSPTIGKNLIPTPRFFLDDGTLAPQWSAIGGHSTPTLDADEAPFGYAQRVLRAPGTFTLDLLTVHALPLVGTDIVVGGTYRRPPARIAVRFFPTATAGAVALSTLAAHNVTVADPTGDWETVSATVAAAQVPAGANFFTLRLVHANTNSVLDLAELTCKYML